MGKNNRARRGERHRAAQAASPNEPNFPSDELLDELFELATIPTRYRLAEHAHRATARLCALDASVVNNAVERRVLKSVASAWSNGWQPSELVRQVRRSTDARTATFALIAIATEHARWRATAIDPRWSAQLAELDLPHVDESRGWISEWARNEHASRPEEVDMFVALLRGLVVTPIPILIPPPGTQPGDDWIIDLTVKTNDPILNRVRALLAQAESTQFEAEAETFTAKAQQLMTRHAIDMVMISAGSRRSERPASIRISIDDPYTEAKSMLLHVVAESARCRAVFHPGLAMSSVVGFAYDLDATETLFTSLLVQAQVAMRAAAAHAPPGTRARSRAFRSAFLMAYADRVAERLAEINEWVVADAEAETGRDIMPVLAERSSVVEETVGAMFGRLGRSKIRRGFDAAGWASGRMAADRARLNRGDIDQPIPTPAARLDAR